MIIGISGKKQAGKDTIGMIIQWLTQAIIQKEYPNILDYIKDCKILGMPGTSTDDRMKYYSTITYNKKQFSYKLKLIVALLTGIPVGDMEKEDVKNAPLPAIWDSLREYTTTRREYDIDSTTKDGVPKECELRKITLRETLQQVGTDLFRNQFHDNTWANALFLDYRPLDYTKRAWTGSVLDYSDCPFPNWVITDIRFPNECQEVLDRRGILIRVNRWPKRENKGSDLCTCGSRRDDHKYRHPFTFKDQEHFSERALDDYVGFTYVIENIGTIEELVDRIREILLKENLI